MNDVDLVFDNAMQFNADESIIYVNARELKVMSFKEFVGWGANDTEIGLLPRIDVRFTKTFHSLSISYGATGTFYRSQ